MGPQAEAWFRAAEQDRRAAGALLREGEWNLAAFHAQQAAEKALKALLAEGGRHVRTHSCTELWRAAVAGALVFPAGFDTACMTLDHHYAESRYPNAVGGEPARLYNESLAEELIKLADGVLDHVRRALGA